jgi:hypothetical protein
MRTFLSKVAPCESKVENSAIFSCVEDSTEGKTVLIYNVVLKVCTGYMGREPVLKDNLISIRIYSYSG